MPDLPERKVGIVACSGEELALGTVSRLATLKVLHELRPGKTVTICLPLFLAGGEGDRAFARFHPTITVDGCELRCAARGTEMYSGKPTESLVVGELAAANGLEGVDGRRNLNDAGRRAVDLTAERLALLVDEVLASPSAKTLVTISAPQPPEAPKTVGCSCGSGIPVQKVVVDGQWVELLALPLIFANFRERGRQPDVAADELLASVAIYNSIPEQSKTLYREAILREYASFWRGGMK
ncbi:MAG TPA: putative zinc-binding protein [Candidatus Sulfotelmatobacter sp.]|nr:putative zinc-binding protein [Candidatus Sulfotelmatobacter sp.]